MAIYSGFSHWKWWFSIVMLNYQRVFQTYSKHVQIASDRQLLGNSPKLRHFARHFAAKLRFQRVETRCFGKAHIGVEVQHQSPSNIRIVRKPCAVWLSLEKQNPAPRYRGGSKRKWTGFVLECKKRTQQTLLWSCALSARNKPQQARNCTSKSHLRWHTQQRFYNEHLIDSTIASIVTLQLNVDTFMLLSCNIYIYIRIHNLLYITSIYNIHCHRAVWTKAQWASAAPWCRSQE